jgi:DNA-binding NarL/FixJ family response regulator
LAYAGKYLNMTKITILIADDHKLIRTAWSFTLNNNPQLQVIAECETAEEAIEQTNKLRPDIVIMDINLPGMNGIEATATILKYAPDTRILAISQHTETIYVRQIMQKGAMGYLTKFSPKEEMFKAIFEIHNGRKYICDEIKKNLSEQMYNPDTEKNGIDSLTVREMEIIEHIKKGDSSKEIAQSLFLSVKTIEVHRYNILRKLNLKNSTALVNFVHMKQLEFNESRNGASKRIHLTS